MKIKMVLTAILFAALISACNVQIGGLEVKSIDPKGVQVREERPVKDFNRVQMAGVGKLEISQGSQEKLVVEADEAYLPYLNTRVENGTLILGETQPGIIFTNMDQITYTLTVKQLQGISLSGLGNVESGPLTASSMDIQVSGSGDIVIENLQADALNVQISGLGSARLTGKVTRQQVSISGSGHYEASGLESDDVVATISGLGSMEIWAKNTLKAAISGSGNIAYYGEPALTSDVSGLGNLESRGKK